MIADIRELKSFKTICSCSLLAFTRYFFKVRYKRKFVVGDHHKLICEALEKVMRGETTRLIINIAPRYGKTSLGVINFIAHALAINPQALFLHLSYSSDLALTNSTEIRDLFLCEEFRQMFPDSIIKGDTKSKKKWATTQGGGVYATAAGGQVTGFGAGKVQAEEEEVVNEFMNELDTKKGFGGAIVIDDPIKPDDADNSNGRLKVNMKFDSTIVNRTNSRKTPIIIIMQRLHPDDLCGYVAKQGGWEILNLPCLYESEGETKSLWPHKHTVPELNELRKNNTIVFERQYMQNPKPLEGLLYNTYKTYTELPCEPVNVKSHTDVADTGTDYLCNIIYFEFLDMKYLIDVYYTQDPNEITEPEVARRLAQYSVNQSKIESNAGGRAFGRNVEKICRSSGNYKAMFNPFHQSGNKVARIMNNASTVQNTCVYPTDWAIRWPGFYNSMTSFMSANCEDEEGHDDAQDTITGIVEGYSEPLKVRINR